MDIKTQEAKAREEVVNWCNDNSDLANYIETVATTDDLSFVRMDGHFDLESIIELIAQSYEAGRKAERCDMRNTIIPKYNAEILNQFQQQGTPTMPLIAYDERVCLIPAMDKAILFLDDLINARNEKPRN